jgi:hypothetical protein
MTALRAAILTAALTLAAGCATVTKEDALKLGSFEVLHGRPAGAVLGAPHGTGDTNTGAITKLLAQDLGVSAVIARGFTRHETGDMRINVNRPTEGAHLSPNQESWTLRAKHVFREYRRLVLDAAGPNLLVLVEIHCTVDTAVKGAIEVGTTGMSREQARRVKDMYYRALDAATAGTNIRRVELRIEPIDAVAMNGAAAKQFGTPALAQVSLQIELPLSVTPLALGNGTYRKVLNAFLRDAIAYLSTPRAS